MRVLHICSSYFETNLFNCLFHKLEAFDVTNYVYVPRYHSEGEDTGNRIFVIKKKFSRLAKFFYWGEQKYILKEIESRINVSEIDTVHVHRILYGGYAALQMKRRYGIPYIVAIRNSDIYAWGRNMSVFKKHCLEIMLNAQKVVFLSNAYKEKVWGDYSAMPKVRAIKERTVVITNGIDQYFVDNTSTVGSHPIPKEKEINMISIGWIDKNKNLPTVIKACKILIDRGYKVHLKLLGKIVDEKIFRKASSLDFVEYMGFRPKEEIVDMLRNSDIFVLPSIHESFGLVYAEAMTQGVPIIYTRGQGFDGQYPEGEVGYSVDCFNASEIADRVINILSEYQDISDRCIRYSSRYSWDKIASRYKEIYDEL